MYHNKIKQSIIALIILISIISISAVALKWKPMTFDNPGTKRLLKSATGNHYYFRALPEKSMYVNVKDLTAIEIRSISKVKVSKPQLILKYDDKRVTYDLKLVAVSAEYQIYEPIRITLPPGLTRMELICYNTNIYFRAFQPVPVQNKKPKTPSLKIISHAGVYNLEHETKLAKYYGFTDTTGFSFQVNKGVPITLYVRAQLTERQLPIYGVYENGKLLRKITLSMKRTNTYTTDSIAHLTIGKRDDFSAQDKVKTYTLKALTPHLFIARAVVRKTK